MPSITSARHERTVERSAAQDHTTGKTSTITSRPLTSWPLFCLAGTDADEESAITAAAKVRDRQADGAEAIADQSGSTIVATARAQIDAHVQQ